MKKLNIILVFLSIIHISGCSQNQNKVNDNKSSSESAISNTIFTIKNSDDVTKDFAALQSIPVLAESENTDFRYQIIDAMHNKDYKKAHLILNQMKNFTQKYNQQLDHLDIKSSEVNNLRDLLKEFNQLAIKVTEHSIQENMDKNQSSALEQKMEEIMFKIDAQTKLIEQNISKKT
ncbi:hypothetical protein [Acinetobacter sp. ANC 4648]|uniref:hypothetical protein n=1 Tax=Acinetobacter sp. ANC 4648 TaxID=1977875 RepID=UPI000A3389D8|nr:hypothetical protein [Acinetobacter sp. ANC 4648]OTG81618.1 hypothetical protein B9T27_10100 [Acinetobacter sp. ANC 4648]